MKLQDDDWRWEHQLYAIAAESGETPPCILHCSMNYTMNKDEVLGERLSNKYIVEE